MSERNEPQATPGCGAIDPDPLHLALCEWCHDCGRYEMDGSGCRCDKRCDECGGAVPFDEADGGFPMWPGIVGGVGLVYGEECCGDKFDNEGMRIEGDER